MESKLNRLHPLFKMKHLLKVIGIIFVSHFTEGCTTLKGTGAVASGTAVFVYNPVSTAGGVIYDVTGNSVTKVQVTYVSGSPLGPADVVPGITFTGNETNGIIAFTFSGVAATDKGTYTLSSSSEGQLQCMTLHILGTGTTPTVQLNSTTVNVEEDTSVTFTCSATSDADPATSFTYTWTYEGNSLASETSNTLTITSAKASDTGKYQCTATEDITGGRSSTSLEVKLTVIEPSSTSTTTSTTSSATTLTTSTTTKSSRVSIYVYVCVPVGGCSVVVVVIIVLIVYRRRKQKKERENKSKPTDHVTNAHNLEKADNGSADKSRYIQKVEKTDGTNIGFARV